MDYGLNEGLNQKNLKIWADVADNKMLRPYLKIWEWELILGRAAISSPGVRSPCVAHFNNPRLVGDYILECPKKYCMH